MVYAEEILNILLDRYERSGHCLPGRESSRRIALSFTRGDYPPYRPNDPCTGEINHVVQEMNENGLVTFSWRKGYENWLIDKVFLNFDGLHQAYGQVGRTPLRKSSASLCEILTQAHIDIHTPWKRSFLEDELSNLQNKLRPSRLLPGNEAQVEAILKVLRYTEQGPELMRVISANCFRDSKFLEKNLLSPLISITKAYEPELIAYRSAGEELLTDSVVMEQLGILTYPEIFELCGNIQFCFRDQVGSAAGFRRGFCLQSENMGNMEHMELPDVKTILLIENRTNYRAVVRQGVSCDTLVVYHGGFYSPVRRKFFRMLKEGAVPGVKVLFWGDIDLGGFLMFTRLKKDVFPELTPWKMSLQDYNAYKVYGMRQSPTYLVSLRQRMEERQFDEAFFSVAQAIAENGVTVEQEIML